MKCSVGHQLIPDRPASPGDEFKHDKTEILYSVLFGLKLVILLSEMKDCEMWPPGSPTNMNGGILNESSHVI